MKIFDEHHHSEVSEDFIRNMRVVMISRGIVMSFPDNMTKKVKELREQSKKIMKDPKISEKEKKEIIARYDEKIKQIEQSVVRFKAQHAK